MQGVFLIKSHMLSESLTANHLLLFKKKRMENKNGSLDVSCMPCKFDVNGCTCIKDFDDIF